MKLKQTLALSVFGLGLSTYANAGVETMQFSEAHNLTLGSGTITVAVIDTGVSYRLPAFRGAIALNDKEVPFNNIDDDKNGLVDDRFGYDFANDDADPADENDHGTYVAGLVRSYAPGVKLLPIQVLDSAGSGSTENVVKGIDYAISRKVSMILMALGGGRDVFLCDALHRAANAGILVVAPAGNDGSNQPMQPALCASSSLLIATGLTNSDTLPPWANHSDKYVHVAAPGVNVSSLGRNGNQLIYTGSTASTGLTAAVAALRLSYKAGESIAATREALIMGADYLPDLNGKVASGGRLNALAVLRY